MDPRLLRYYEQELKHVRGMGGEFARDFPKIAGRLGLDAFECADPYVERLIEAFALLTARVHLRLDAEFPEFTQQLMELLYPGYLAPTPSMAVVQLQPSLRHGSLANGFAVPRDTPLRGPLGASLSACEYRTAHPVKLWPLTIASAEYRRASSTHDGELANFPDAKATLRITLKAQGGRTFERLAIESLPLFLRGTQDVKAQLYEHLLSANIGMIVRSPEQPTSAWHVVTTPAIAPYGFADEHALLPTGPRAFQGHRLLHEYFAFPERYMFVELRSLGLLGLPSGEVELILLFNELVEPLEGSTSEAQFAPFCTPVVNLFPRNADRVQLSEQTHEYHVLPDRTRPLDYEVHTVRRVVGHGAAGDAPREFTPMYGQTLGSDSAAHFTIRRQPRKMSAREASLSSSVPYVPSDLYLSLVDGPHGPFRSDLRQLSVDTLCTNRGLPLQMSVGRGHSDFTDQSGAPIEAVRCLAGPTPPRSTPVFGRVAWNLISHLSLDYGSMLCAPDGQSAAPLRQLLALYAGFAELGMQKQVEGILDLSTRSVVRPLPLPGPVTFGRGIELSLTCDEASFRGTGVFLLGAVLEQFFAKYASINSFTQTVLTTKQRGEVMRWPTTTGRRNLL